MTKNKALLGDIALFLVAILWGLSFVLCKNALNSVSPYYLLTTRFSISFFLLALIFIKRFKYLNLKTFLSGSLIGLLLFIAFSTQTKGLVYTTASKNSFLTGTNVIMVPFLYWIISKKAPDIYSIISTLLCLIGISLLTLTSEGFSINLGDMLTLIAAFFFAAHIISVSYFTKHHDPILLTIIQFGITTVLSFLSYTFFETPVGTLSNSTWISLIYISVIATLIAFLVQNIAQKYTSPTHTAIILSTEALFGVLFSSIMLKEHLTVINILGCFLILIAIILSETKFSFLHPLFKKEKAKLK